MLCYFFAKVHLSSGKQDSIWKNKRTFAKFIKRTFLYDEKSRGLLAACCALGLLVQEEQDGWRDGLEGQHMDG